ncbi:helix-turn-helix transcriptional regulator [Archaeoglobus sp.]
MRPLIVTVIIILLLLTPVKSAVIKGNVYSWELKKIKAVVEINTTPVQRVVAVNGSYEFNVPLGVYEIRAYSDGLECNETIVIKRDGIYTIDLILFPNIDSLYGEYNFTELNFSLATENKGKQPLLPILLCVAIASTVAVYYVVRTKKRREYKNKEGLPEDLETILEILKDMGGRATQKELRKKLGWSEAKLSLALTDLERRGLIEKFKKGRGNVIFLKK